MIGLQEEKAVMLLHIEFPERLVDMNKQELEALAFESLLVRLYDLGHLSSSEGAKLLSITEENFLTFSVSITSRFSMTR